jgi:hypothetical protein
MMNGNRFRFEMMMPIVALETQKKPGYLHDIGMMPEQFRIDVLIEMPRSVTTNGLEQKLSNAMNRCTRELMHDVSRAVSEHVDTNTQETDRFDFIKTLKAFLIEEKGRTAEDAASLITRFPNVVVNGIMNNFNYRATAIALEMMEDKAKAAEPDNPPKDPT